MFTFLIILFIAIYVGISALIFHLWSNYTILTVDCMSDAITIGFLSACWPVSFVMLLASMYDHKHGLD